MVLWLFRILYVILLGTFLFLFGVVDFAYNTIWFYFGIVGALIIGFVGAISMTLLFMKVSAVFRKNKPIDNKFNHHIANSLLLLAQKLLRVKIIVSGRENIPKKPFVLVANHQENYDVIVLKPIFKDLPLDFIAKEAVFNIPIIGEWIKILGNIPITKEADRAAAEAIIKGIRLYKKGMPVGIFPEGRRSFSNEMIPFKAGAFKLAMKPKADLLILTQYNVSNTFKGWPFKKQKIHVHIHPIMPYESYKEKNSQELSDDVRKIIQAQLDVFNKTIG
ncbi:MAG: lysophospholipid acyltransferase family protein [Candidatus Izemoplasmataceae bacterium]